MGRERSLRVSCSRLQAQQVPRRSARTAGTPETPERRPVSGALGCHTQQAPSSGGQRSTMLCVSCPSARDKASVC